MGLHSNPTQSCALQPLGVSRLPDGPILRPYKYYLAPSVVSDVYDSVETTRCLV